MKKELLSVNEAIKRYDLPFSAPTLRKLVLGGEIPGLKFGNRIFVFKTKLEDRIRELLEAGAK